MTFETKFETIPMSIDRLRGVRVRRRSDVPLAAVLEAVNGPGEVLKESHKSLTSRVGGWVVKSSGREAGLGLLKRTFRGGRYRRAWDAAVYIAQHGEANVPRPVAFVEFRRFGLVTHNAFLCEYLDKACDVEAFADRHLVEKADDTAIHAYLARIADAVNTLMGEWGPHHTDLAGKNILTRDGETFYFIDLDSVVLGRRYTEDHRLKNHVQLYDSFCDRWDDEYLEPFVARMLPNTDGLSEWMHRVRELQATRRARTEAAWRKQGRL